MELVDQGIPYLSAFEHLRRHEVHACSFKANVLNSLMHVRFAEEDLFAIVPSRCGLPGSGLSVVELRVLVEEEVFDVGAKVVIFGHAGFCEGLGVEAVRYRIVGLKVGEPFNELMEHFGIVLRAVRPDAEDDVGGR